MSTGRKSTQGWRAIPHQTTRTPQRMWGATQTTRTIAIAMTMLLPVVMLVDRGSTGVVLQDL